jgi:hypothetical protein
MGGENLGLRERFLKIYADIPLSLRKEIILILDDEPISWNVSFIEVKNNTPKSNIILKKLNELKII